MTKKRDEKKYIIYDSYDVLSEENQQNAKDNLIDNKFFGADENDCITVIDNYGIEVKITREQYASSLTKEQINSECYELNNMWYSDESLNLKACDENYGLIAIANLGLWSGGRVGYKEVTCLADVLNTNCDYETVYVDSNGDLRKKESHHDGHNSILYRYWKDGITEEQKDNFRLKCYRGELKKIDITRYTRKAGVSIAKSYGWKVRC